MQFFLQKRGVMLTKRAGVSSHSEPFKTGWCERFSTPQNLDEFFQPLELFLAFFQTLEKASFLRGEALQSGAAGSNPWKTTPHSPGHRVCPG